MLPTRLLLLLCVTPLVNCFRFVLREEGSEEECFTISEPSESPFTLHYSFPGSERAKETVRIALTDVLSTKVLSQFELTEDRGTLSFTTGSDARHMLCVGVGADLAAPTGRKRGLGSRSKKKGGASSNTHHSLKPMVFEMTLQRGHSNGYYEEMAAKEHLDRLELEVVRLTDELAQILNEVDYMKEKERVRDPRV